MWNLIQETIITSLESHNSSCLADTNKIRKCTDLCYTSE